MNILIISPYFPPYSGVGAIRMASLSRFLVKKGENVSILRNSPEYWLDEEKKSIEPEGVTIFDVDEQCAAENKGYFHNFADAYCYYRNSLGEIFKKNRYDVIIISAGPFYTVPLCGFIKRKSKSQIVIDYRDLWISKYFKVDTSSKLKATIANIFSSRIEKRALHFVSKVVVVTESDLSELQSRYSKSWTKFVCIYNGYDDENLNKKDKIHENKMDGDGALTLAIFGKFATYSTYYASMVLNSIKQLEVQYPNLKIIQVGGREKVVSNLMEQFEIDETKFESVGFMEYAEGIKILRRAFAFILVNNHPTGLGTKVFDYIYCNKPIFYVGKSSTVLARFVSNFQNGRICENVEQLSKAIVEVIENKIKYLDEEMDMAMFGRSRQNEKYYNVIKSLMEKGD